MALSLAKEAGFWLGMLSGFWSSAPDLTPPIQIGYFSVVGLFGVGVLVVNCIVDASIFDLCKMMLTDFFVGWCCFCC